SCDVLEEEIISGVTVDTHYGTPDGFVDAVNAAYQQFRDFYGDEDGCEITVFGTDEYTNGGHGGAQYINKYIAGLNGESNTFWDPWQRFYEGINTCNAVIGRAAEADIPADEKAVLVAEVKFLRAHYYFLLVQFWGPVHLTLEETVGVETEATRAPESDIYDAIIADLQDAIADRPVTQSEFGRITKPAAQHGLALVYLTRAYQPYGQASDFSDAADLAVEVIGSGHELLDDYQEIYNIADANGHLLHTNEQNNEILWSIQYDIDPLKNDEGNRTHVYFRAWYETFNDGLDRALGHGYGRPWIRFRPTHYLLNSFRPLDVDSRYEKSFATVWLYNTDRNIPAGASVGDTAIVITDKTAAEIDTAAMYARLPGVKIFTWNIAEIDEDWCLWRTDVSVNSPNINIFPVPWKIDDNLRSS
ncbi:MAG: RagB/SusD family nutrient uptake outer membrane protein, partial [Bacteroidales bacterium]|nr:RagB/SusD family nutrient uptake outer membrane protein [Bacteroidales bacterium]